jgi:trigger factor
MEVTQIQAQGLKREFNVLLLADDLAQRVEGQLAEIKAKAHIPGFRPGKVPISHLRRLYGRSILAEVVQEAVNEANRKIVDENELRLAMEPKFIFADDGRDLEKVFEARSDFEFKVALEVLPKIEVQGLDAIEIERLVAEVSSSDIDQVLLRLAETNRSYAPKGGEAIAETGDKVTLNFAGTIDGVPFDGGSGKDLDLVLGSANFLPGFEAQIEGMKGGERRTITVTFPDNYNAAKLAGKLASFDVTLNSVAAPGKTEIGDELATGLGFENLAKLRDGIRANVERDYLAASRARWKRDLLDALDKKFLFEVPESMVSQEFDAIWRQIEAERSQSGRSYDDDHTTEQAERAEYQRIAERRVRLGLLLAEIGEFAKIKVTEEEIAQAVARRARASRGEDKVVWDVYRKDPRALAEVKASLFEEKVIDYVISQVKVTDKTVSKDELLNALGNEDDHATESRSLEAVQE